MPSRVDLFDKTEQLLGLCGVQTVFRGEINPTALSAFPDSCYPLVAYVEKKQQLDPQSNYAYDTHGEVELWLFYYAGTTGDPKISDNRAAWKGLDLLVDTIMQQFAAYFAGDAAMGGNTSNTTVLELSEFDPWPFYPMQFQPELAAGAFTLSYRMAFS